MREFKFRAWAKKTKNLRFEHAWKAANQKYDKEPRNGTQEWSEWYDTRKEYWEKMCNEYIDQEEENSFVMIDDDKFSVGKVISTNYGYEILDIMQYTGVKDKNGVEIYEGDIIEYDGAETRILEVRYKNAEFVARSDFWSATLENVFFDCKVIGNIYQNNELLEA